MLRLATDEDFNNKIVRGLRRRDPALDILRAQEARLSGSDDFKVLAWAIARAVEEILLLAQCSHPGEWEGQVLYLPLR